MDVKCSWKVKTMNMTLSTSSRRFMFNLGRQFTEGYFKTLIIFRLTWSRYFGIMDKGWTGSGTSVILRSEFHTELRCYNQIFLSTLHSLIGLYSPQNFWLQTDDTITLSWWVRSTFGSFQDHLYNFLITRMSSLVLFLSILLLWRWSDFSRRIMVQILNKPRCYHFLPNKREPRDNYIFKF